MDLHYLLRDSQEIFGIYISLDLAYNYLLQFLYNFYRYNKILTGDSCNIKILIKNFQIIQYNNNVVINIYQLDSNFKLIDVNMIAIKFTSISIIDLLLKLDNINDNDNINIDSNELNLFIPITITETSHPVNNRDLIELETKMNMLKTMKENEKINLDKIKDNIKIKEEQVFMEKIKNESIKNKLEQKKEYYDKLFNKFKIDKDIYFKIKKEIDNGERNINNLPILFIDEYNIFNKLNNENYLNSSYCLDDIFQQYLKFKPEKTQHFVSNYDNIFENDNWGNKGVNKGVNKGIDESSDSSSNSSRNSSRNSSSN